MNNRNVNPTDITDILNDLSEVIMFLKTKCEKYKNLCSEIKESADKLTSYDNKPTGNVEQEQIVGTNEVTLLKKVEYWDIKVDKELTNNTSSLILSFDEMIESLEKLESQKINIESSVEDIKRSKQQLETTLSDDEFKNFLQNNLSYDEYNAAKNNYDMTVSDGNVAYWTDEPLVFTYNVATGAYLITQGGVGMGWTSKEVFDNIQNRIYQKNLQAEDLSIDTALEEKLYIKNEEKNSILKEKQDEDLSIDTALEEKLYIKNEEKNSILKEKQDEDLSIDTALEEKFYIKNEEKNSILKEKQDEDLSIDTALEEKLYIKNNIEQDNNSSVVNNVTEHSTATSSEQIPTIVYQDDISSEVKTEIANYTLIQADPKSNDTEIKTAFDNLSQEAKDIINGNIKLINPSDLITNIEIQNSDNQTVKTIVNTLIDQKQDIIVPEGSKIYINGDVLNTFDFDKEDTIFRYDPETKLYRGVMKNGEFSYGGYTLEEMETTVIK